MATNLEFIKSEIVNDVISFSMTDCFSDKYENYFVTIQGLDHNLTSRHVTMLRFINSSGVVTSANYDMAKLGMRANNTFSDDYGTALTSIHEISADGYGKGSGTSFYVYNPYSSSNYTFVNYQVSAYYDIHGSLRGVKGIGVLNIAETHLGFNIFDFGGFKMYNGKISVFGVK